MTRLTSHPVIRGLMAIAFLATFLPAAAVLRAQETTGTIQGTLRDQTGGVLRGVRVVVTSVDTGQTIETATNNVGQYTIALPIGNYSIRFLLPNFRVYIANGISLHVNDRLAVNAKLDVGAVETLTVTAKRLVQQTAAVQTLIPSVAIRELPLLARTPIQLVTLVPGVSSDLREETCFCDQGNLDISINGGRRSSVNWLLDGASNVNGWTNYTLVTTPSLEAIQEINVITSSYSAEWPRYGGGIVNAVTKAGANRFSGSAYEFLRNDGLNANSFFRNMDPNPAINDQPRRLRYNNFGYTAGGPALPARKTLFFFFSQEWRRSARDKQTFESRVPDPLWLTDPTNPNYVPPAARDPNAMKLLTQWPQPNIPGTNRYVAPITNRFDTRQEFVRADYRGGASWSLTGRYLHDRVDSRGEYATTPDLAPGHRALTGRLAVLEARHIAGRFVFDGSYQLATNRQDRLDGITTRSQLDLTTPELFAENSGNLIPGMFVVGLNSINRSHPSPRDYRNHTVSASLTTQFGRHTLRAGGLVGYESMDANLFSESTEGVFFFTSGGGYTPFQNFLRGNADGACGAACVYSETDQDVANRLRSRRYEFFAQDAWRIHPNATIDLGLRYAYYPPFVDAHDMLFTFSPDAYDPAQAPTFADSAGSSLTLGTGNMFNGIELAGRNSPLGRSIYPADTNNFQPRLGLAWDPDGRGQTVVRFGYGMYFDQIQYQMFADGMEFSSFDPLRTDVIVTNASLSNPLASGPAVWPKSRELLFPQSFKPGTVLTPQATATSDRLVMPRRQHWNIGFERELYAGGLLDAGYIGGRGDHLLRYVDINQPQPSALIGHSSAVNTVRPFPGYRSIVLRETTAKSRYQGLVTSFRHETTHGLWATVNYTFSRNMADATYDDSVLDDPQNPLDPAAEFSPAGTDRTHIFNASYVYQLPLIHASTTGWRRALLGGWQLAGITRIESGPAARIRVTSCTPFCFPSALRPDEVADAGEGKQDGLTWFDANAFVPPAAGEYGTAPGAYVRLPGRQQWDFALSKSMATTASTRLQFRVDVINAFNHTQFLDVNTSCFGTTTCVPRSANSGFGQVTSTRPPREIQLGIRMDW
ncbi:MAG TPA: carboxypeptidase regulatory-like domain-containing protein [Vicinamibacterales bacterium]|jgi:hypothetical protein|nr:carboxypeptidase regulatory-like domain-containing protein [Vicinamibacterales bacterium]